MIKNFIFEDDGMEMVEWALVAVLFAVAAAVGFGTLSGDVGLALDGVTTSLNP